jgi:glucokinase
VAALSEAAYGKLAGHNFWFMIWGTGVGGSFVESGGSRPTVIPTELGHQMLDWHAKGKRCGCGQAGCLESFAGGAKIKRNRGKAAENLTEREWSEVCDRVSQGLYNLMTIRPVSAIVIGGGIAVKQAQRLSDIEARLARRLRIVPSPTVSLVTHQEEAGLIGALGLLK